MPVTRKLASVARMKPVLSKAEGRSVIRGARLLTSRIPLRSTRATFLQSQPQATKKPAGLNLRAFL